MNERPIFVLFGLGANLGQPALQLAEAIERLARHVEISAISDLYRTEPVGLLAQPDYLNLAAAGETTSTVYDLHRAIRRIEEDLGREPAERNAPRVIDIDLLAYGELAITSADLMVPHPRLHQRSFVLAPLAEIAPNWRHPLLGFTSTELLLTLENPTAVSRIGPLPELPQQGVSGYSPPPPAAH